MKDADIAGLVERLREEVAETKCAHDSPVDLLEEAADALERMAKEKDALWLRANVAILDLQETLTAAKAEIADWKYGAEQYKAERDLLYKLHRERKMSHEGADEAQEQFDKRHGAARIARAAQGNHKIPEQSVAWYTMIRAIKMAQEEAYEKAAKVAEQYPNPGPAAEEIAAAIRGLKGGGDNVEDNYMAEWAEWKSRRGE